MFLSIINSYQIVRGTRFSFSALNYTTDPLNWRNGKYVHILSRTFFLNLEMHQYWTRFQGSSNTLIVNTISFSGVQYEARIRKIFKRAYQTIRQIKVILYAIKTMYAILKLGIVMVLVFNGGSNMLF